ncbi:MAG: ASCH domain-containing protein [Victivallales bacterium]|nr:ASCH domain-containing protein [Victivallales bacterium]
MKILHLTLKKKWFDMILSGEKKEEYRKFKPYWLKRLMNEYNVWKDFDIIRFTNGYGADKPSIDVEFLDVCIGVGKPEWGAPGVAVFVLTFGEIIETRNIKEL